MVCRRGERTTALGTSKNFVVRLNLFFIATEFKMFLQFIINVFSVIWL